jgi:hypothetical protein
MLRLGEGNTGIDPAAVLQRHASTFGAGGGRR